MDTKHVPGETLDIKEMNIQNLKNLFPEAFTEGKIDFDKLKQLLGEYVDDSTERYNFSWNGKGQSLRFSQSTSTGTLRPCPEESKDWDTTNNLYIEGDNLEVLKLLQKSYFGKVKMIYIDPPYNTGNDFVYPDDFKDSIENYKKITGQVNAEGNAISTNTESNGRYHTDWLNMMYPRLRLARNLLKDDGVIFISINDLELPNLLKISDEIFGETNFLGNITWKARVKPVNIGDAKYSPQRETENILVYGKKPVSERFYPITSGSVRSYPNTFGERKYRLATILKSNRGTNYRSTMSFEFENYTPPEGQRWQASVTEIRSLFENGYIEFRDGTPMRRYFEDEEGEEHTPFYCYLDNEWSSTSETGKSELNNLLGSFHGFDTVKPTTLIKTLIMSCTKSDDVIMDFFSGTGTTAESMIQTNGIDFQRRKFLLIQLPEPCSESNKIDDYYVKTICEIGKERIRRAGDKIKQDNPDAKDLDIGFKVLKLDSSNIKRWNSDVANLETTLEGSVSNWIPGRTDLDVVYEILIKLGLPLDIKIEQTTINGKTIYTTGSGALIVCLADGIDLGIAKKIIEIKETDKPETCKIVFRDNGFKTDSDKTNVLETLRAAGIEEILSI